MDVAVPEVAAAAIAHHAGVCGAAACDLVRTSTTRWPTTAAGEELKTVAAGEYADTTVEL